MSWETFLIGQIQFKQGTSDEEIERVLAVLEIERSGQIPHFPSWTEYRKGRHIGACEVWFDEQAGMYNVESINYTSHLSEEKFETIKKEHGSAIQLIYLSLFYLNKPDVELDTTDDGLMEVEVSFA